MIRSCRGPSRTSSVLMKPVANFRMSIFLTPFPARNVKALGPLAAPGSDRERLSCRVFRLHAVEDAASEALDLGVIACCGDLSAQPLGDLVDRQQWPDLSRKPFGCCLPTRQQVERIVVGGECDQGLGRAT